MPVKSLNSAPCVVSIALIVVAIAVLVRTRHHRVLGAIAVLYYAWLSVNPVRRDKADALMAIPARWRPDTVVLDAPPDADTALPSLPVIVKPNRCQGEGGGVVYADTRDAVTRACRTVLRTECRVIVQAYAPGRLEVGVFFRRYPWERVGCVVSVVARRFPDDHAGPRIWNADVAAQDAAHYERYTGDIPAAFAARMSRIARRISDRLHMCRFDVVCDSYADLFAGVFRVLECNGSMAYDLSFWAQNVLPRQSWLYMGRWTLDHVLIGTVNALTLRGVPIADVPSSDRVRDALRCNDWEKLLEYGHM